MGAIGMEKELCWRNRGLNKVLSALWSSLRRGHPEVKHSGAKGQQSAQAKHRQLLGTVNLRQGASEGSQVH